MWFREKSTHSLGSEDCSMAGFPLNQGSAVEQLVICLHPSFSNWRSWKEMALPSVMETKMITCKRSLKTSRQHVMFIMMVMIASLCPFKVLKIKKKNHLQSELKQSFLKKVFSKPNLVSQISKH